MSKLRRLFKLGTSPDFVPDPVVFRGDLDQIREIAEQEQSEHEPNADAIRAELRRLHDEKTIDTLQPLDVDDVVDWEGLRRRKTIVSNPNNTRNRAAASKTIHPPPDIPQATSREADRDFQRAVTSFNLKRFDLAEREFQTSLEVRTRLNGRDHQETLDTEHWLACSLQWQGKYKEAEKHFRRAWAGRMILFGRDHLNTLSSRIGLADALYCQDKFREAEAQDRETLSILKERPAPSLDEILNREHALGLCLLQQGDAAGAEEHFRRAALGLEELLGFHDEETLDSIELLALSLMRQRKWGEADELYRRAAVGRKERSSRVHLGASDNRKAPTGVPELQLTDAADRRWQKAADRTRQEFEGRARRDIEDGMIRATGSTGGLANGNSKSKASSTVLPDASLKYDVQKPLQQLNGFFETGGPERSAYTDSEITTISRLLTYQNPSWSRVPRTYIVLRMINCLHLLDNIVAFGFTDYWFPVTATNLPAILNSNQKSDFVAAQHLVLTKSLDLEKGADGQHCYFDKDEVLPLEKQRILGRGAFGQVDEVLSLTSYMKYAGKRVLRNDLLRGRKPEHLNLFISEIETLKRLRHKHVVQFVGSYSDTKYLGLLLRPVAEMDLSTYLIRSDISSRSGELRTFFGCLASGLDFLHSESVRHKDIKPENVLVDRGNILFTDFGLSHDFADGGNSTTISMVNGLSARYCAPEVALCEPRNKSSDIWSLGVVYLEMLIALKGLTPEFMRSFFDERGSRQPYVRTNRRAFNELLDHLRTIGHRGDHRVADWVGAMLQEIPTERPHTSLLVATINDSSKNGDESKRFCGICCLSLGEDDIAADFSD